MKDTTFKTKFDDTEKTFVEVNHIFPRNKIHENYLEIMEELSSSYKALKCNVSLKLDFLDPHLNFFPDNSWYSIK